MRKDDYKKETLLASGRINSETNSSSFDVRGYDGYVMVTKLTISSGDVNVNLQGSLDGTNWFEIEATDNQTATGYVVYNVDKPYYWYARINLEVNSGSATVQVIGSKSAD